MRRGGPRLQRDRRVHFRAGAFLSVVLNRHGDRLGSELNFGADCGGFFLTFRRACRTSDVLKTDDFVKKSLLMLSRGLLAKTVRAFFSSSPF
jgi:hypothetical protein